MRRKTQGIVVVRHRDAEFDCCRCGRCGRYCCCVMVQCGLNRHRTSLFGPSDVASSPLSSERQTTEKCKPRLAASVRPSGHVGETAVRLLFIFLPRPRPRLSLEPARSIGQTRRPDWRVCFTQCQSAWPDRHPAAEVSRLFGKIEKIPGGVVETVDGNGA